MKSCKLAFATHRLGKPADWDEEKHGPCIELEAYEKDGVFVTGWLPSPEEIGLLLKGEPLYVHIVGGQPAMQVTVGEQKAECQHHSVEIGQRDGDGMVIETCVDCGHVKVLAPPSQLDVSSYATN